MPLLLWMEQQYNPSIESLTEPRRFNLRVCFPLVTYKPPLPGIISVTGSPLGARNQAVGLLSLSQQFSFPVTQSRAPWVPSVMFANERLDFAFTTSPLSSKSGPKFEPPNKEKEKECYMGKSIPQLLFFKHSSNCGVESYMHS